LGRYINTSLQFVEFYLHTMKPSLSTLIERYFVVQFPPMDDGDRFALAVKVEDGLRQAYPSCCVKNDTVWSFKIVPDEAGVPKLDGMKMGEATNLWEMDDQAVQRSALWRVRIEAGRIVVNYRKNRREDPGSFEELQALLDQTLPLCKAGLHCQKWDVALHYLFHFDGDTVSASGLVKPDRIEVRELLQPFAALPALDGFKIFIPDYRWTQRWVQNRSGREYISSADISTLKDPHLAIRLDLATGENGRPVKDAIFKDLFLLLRDNAEKLFVPGAWEELQEDCV
jgi:hypothetical protein